MNNKIAELMKLNAAVDTICEAVENENAEKDKKIMEGYRAKWEAMWDDLDELLPIVNELGIELNHKRIGKYTFGHIYGYAYGLTIVYNRGFPATVALDSSGGCWDKATRSAFNRWIEHDRPVVECLLNNWIDVKFQIEEDFENLLKAAIHNKAEKAANRTEELDRKLQSL